METQKDKKSCKASRLCCRVEAVVGVDERGQMVLPKDVREKAGIQAGDKLAVVMWEQGEEVCCLVLVKAEKLATTVQDLMGPAKA